MKNRLTLIALITMFTFTKQVLAVDLSISNIQLGATLEQGMEEVDKFKSKFDETTFDYNVLGGQDENDNIIYYSSNIKPKPNNETFTSNENYLGIYASNKKIWSVSRKEHFKTGPLKQLFIESLKKKYGEPTHSGGLSDEKTSAELIWLYDDKGNRVEGTHNHDSYSKRKNDVCNFSEIRRNTSITRFTPDPLCGKFIVVELLSDYDNLELISSYRILSADYHNEYKNILDMQNKKKEEAEKLKEKQREDAKNFKPDF